MLKSFLVRLLQVVWIIGFVAVLWSLYASIALYGEILLVISSVCIWIIFFAVIQYLIFSTLDPRALFDGSIMPNSKSSINRRWLAIGFAASLGLAVIGGITGKMYYTYEYNQKIKAGSDTSFYKEVLTDIAYSNVPTDCEDNEEDPPKKADLQRLVSNLKSQGVVGLNILVKIAERNDNIGNALRCAIRDYKSIDEIATIADIDY